MPKLKKAYFEIAIYELQALAGWAADCARSALPMFERFHPEDGRPREAVDAAAKFALLGKRTNALRKVAMDSFRAASNSCESSASFAAKSASFAAASAFTHPFADLDQARHILGSAVCAAMAVEQDGGGDPGIGVALIDSAAAAAPDAVVDLLAKMPPQAGGKTRQDELYALLDLALRRRRQSLESAP